MKPEKPIYFLSGLGADERVFQRLVLPDFECHYIKWLEPHVNESIQEYALRLTEQIKHREIILIGLSFGGIMAQEIAKLLPVKQIILISSIKNRKDIPFFIRFWGSFGIHKLLPSFFLTNANFFTYRLFGAKTPEIKSLLAEILQNAPIVFTRWAINQLVNWDNKIDFAQLTHIHGSNDKLIPLKKDRCDFYILGGGHFMVWDRAKEINVILQELLQK